MELIHDIETLRQYVKLNASTDWDTYRPFVLDAQEKYITPYFGEALLETIGSDETNQLRERILRALGPFSLALATHELSINFGETGHTVTRTDKLAPASDAKIKLATDSLLERGWHNLDRALRYVSMNPYTYPTWEAGARLTSTLLFGNFNEFQDEGLLDISYSPLTFMRLRMLIMRIEKSETLLMMPGEYDYRTNGKLLSAMQAYTASRVAEIQTNATDNKNMKDNPPILLLQESDVDSKNYYASQSGYWKSVIINILIDDNAIEDSSCIKWNDHDKTVFVANARRV